MLCMGVLANIIDTGHYVCDWRIHFGIVVAYRPVSVTCVMSVRCNVSGFGHIGPGGCLNMF